MKKLSLAIATVLMCTTAHAAQSYQSVTDVSYFNSDDNDGIGVQSIYFFDPEPVVGPLDQFEFISINSNVFGGFADDDFGDSYNLGGEYFIDDKFVVGGSYQYYDSDFSGHNDTYTLKAGYLFSEDLIVEVERYDSFEGGDAAYIIGGRYTHRLGGEDYIGFSAEIDDDFDYGAVGVKYFKDLEQGNYLVLEGEISDSDEGDTEWELGTSYYFTKMTSVFANFAKNDDYSFGAKHFFNRNFALSGGYGNNWDDSNEHVYFLTGTAQF